LHGRSSDSPVNVNGRLVDARNGQFGEGPAARKTDTEKGRR
jgi:hypothetical protein